MLENDIRRLTCRFTLLDMMRQCEKHSGFIEDQPYDWIDWAVLRQDIQKLLHNYDNGMKLNEDFLIKIHNIKITKNIKIVKRLIQLIKIV